MVVFLIEIICGQKIPLEHKKDKRNMQKKLNYSSPLILIATINCLQLKKSQKYLFLQTFTG